jgi:hypothetical protein
VWLEQAGAALGVEAVVEFHQLAAPTPHQDADRHRLSERHADRMNPALAGNHGVQPLGGEAETGAVIMASGDFQNRKENPVHPLNALDPVILAGEGDFCGIAMNPEHHVVIQKRSNPVNDLVRSLVNRVNICPGDPFRVTGQIIRKQGLARFTESISQPLNEFRRKFCAGLSCDSLQAAS